MWAALPRCWILIGGSGNKCFMRCHGTVLHYAKWQTNVYFLRHFTQVWKFLSHFKKKKPNSYLQTYKLTICVSLRTFYECKRILKVVLKHKTGIPLITESLYNLFFISFRCINRIWKTTSAGIILLCKIRKLYARRTFLLSGKFPTLTSSGHLV